MRVHHTSSYRSREIGYFGTRDSHLVFLRVKSKTIPDADVTGTMEFTFPSTKDIAERYSSLIRTIQVSDNTVRISLLAAGI
jgi:hypothetical protein